MIQATKQVVKTSAVWECLGTHEVDSNSGNLGSANSRDLWWRYCGKPNQIDNLPIYCNCVSKSSLLPWHFGPTKETSKCAWSLWTFSSTSIPWHQITVFPCIPIGGSMFTPPWVVQPIQPINSMKKFQPLPDPLSGLGPWTHKLTMAMRKSGRLDHQSRRSHGSKSLSQNPQMDIIFVSSWTIHVN